VQRRLDQEGTPTAPGRCRSRHGPERKSEPKASWLALRAQRVGGIRMAGAVKKSFESPDERRTPDKTEVEVVNLGSVKAARMTLQPGWRWSECIKPIAGTDSCQVHHEGMVAAGRMHVRHDDGTEIEIGAGDAYVIEPGHDAWVEGSQVFVGYEFDSKAAETYARS
jgi:mannose-6-phosphate isomerase-like protein (cupin superfamily)